jgi:aspartyl protease family protein
LSFSRQNIGLKKYFIYIGLWAIIGLLILIIYSFRNEISAVKDRVVGDLIPNKAINKNHEQLIINISNDDHYYINLDINKKNIKFMVDTGASDIVISKEMAVYLGINIDNLIFDKIFITANGKVSGASTYFEEVSISGVKFYNVAVSISDGKLTTPLLGMSFLRRFYKYEFYQEKLILTL